MTPPRTPATPTQPEAKATRTRGTTPFDEAKRAQSKLQALDEKRAEIIGALTEEAAVMLEALEELRAKQSVAQEPTAEAAAE